MTSIAAAYEAERLANIAENQRILSALFQSTAPRNAPAVPTLYNTYPASHSLPSKPSAAPPFISFGHATPKPSRPKRASPSSTASTSTTPGRRSARNEGKLKVDYTKEIVLERWEDAESPFGQKRQREEEGSEEESGEEGEEGEWIVGDDDDGELDEEGEDGEERRVRKRQRQRQFEGIRKREKGEVRGSGKGVKVGKRSQNPKQFGHIPGVAIGTTWKTRMLASRAAVHSPPVGGIFGNAQAGCWSIALSGGWADDVDNGDVFTYTGSGGTLLSGTKNQPKNLRVAPQTFDQSFDHSFNAALKKSCDTGKPVRVIRGYKNPSKYAPVDGYRYDGLYTVIKCWMAPSIANRKLKVCRYALQRLGGQGEIGVKQPQAEDGEAEEGEVAIEEGAEVAEAVEAEREGEVVAEQ